MYGLFAGTKKVAIVEGWLFVEQGSALRKIEGCPAYDLYEKSEIFWSPRSKSWAPRATALLELSCGGGLNVEYIIIGIIAIRFAYTTDHKMK